MRTCSTVNPGPLIRVLLIDDNRNGLIARKAVLEEAGYSAVIAECPRAGLTEFERGHFDLVITDYRMPAMNGAEVIERIRALRPSTPVILMSGLVDVLGLTEANTGADSVIPKTNNEVSHLIRTVNRLLRPRSVRKPPASQRAMAAAAARFG